MTVAWLQRYAIFLSGYNYNIQFRSTKEHCNANGLSRLPLNACTEANEHKLDPEIDFFYNSHFELLHVSLCVTLLEKILCLQVFKTVSLPEIGMIPQICSLIIPEGIKVSVHQGCLVWGLRVVVPKDLRERILKELHEGHQGVVKMNALAHPMSGDLILIKS